MDPTRQKSAECKPLASVSLDLDNQWSYMKTHGDAGWKEFPSYLDIVVPYVLDLLEELDIRITFFIVGQDASQDKNSEYLNMLVQRGHELGNHSFQHEPWLHQYTKDEIRKEIIETDEQIFRVTGQKPVGFRGPGFSWSPDIMEVLAERNYLYDASTLPTYIGPLARMYYFAISDLSEAEKNQRRGLFGTFRDGTRSVKPYFWQLASGATMLEIPVTTVPIIKTPFHLSYLVYLSRFSKTLATSYMKTALALCKLTGTEPSFLLHPTDLIDGNQVPALAFYPGMDISRSRKAELLRQVLKELSKHFTPVNMGSHAQSVLSQEGITVRAAGE